MKRVLWIIAAVALSGCDNRELLENYKGAVVIDKGSKQDGKGQAVCIKYKGQTLNISLYNIDWYRYNVGDTIK